MAKKITLTKNQKKVFTASGVMLDGRKVDVIATVRYGDECNNGRNSFSITGDVYTAGKRSDRAHLMGGCIHEVISEFFPDLAPLIKWHLCGSDMPLYYFDNTLYYAREAVEPNIKEARACAIWPNATLEQLQSRDALNERLPALMAEFRAAVESLGFVY